MDYDNSDIATVYDQARALAPEVLRQWLDLLSSHVNRGVVSLILDLALQLLCCFEVRALSGSLVSSTPE